MSDLKFMWRIPAYPTDGSRGDAFISQLMDALAYIEGGYDGAFLDDHFLPWTAVDHPGGRDGLKNNVDTLECMTTLAFMAAAHPKLIYGPIVLSQAYRNPSLVAKMGANLQQLTHGKFVMGIGTGWYEPDYQAYGYDFPARPGVRLEQMEEAIQVIYAMWRESPATFQGKYYHVKDAYCEPRPNPIPPLLIGAGGEKVALRMVAQHADWWNYCDTVEVYSHKLGVLRAHCQAVGRNFDDIVKTWDGLQMVVARTEDEANRIYERSLFRRQGAIVGTPIQVAKQLQDFVNVGVTVFFLRFDDFPSLDGIRLFAEEVIPLLKR